MSLNRKTIESIAPTMSFNAHCNWYRGDPRFSGIPFAKLMDYCQSYGRSVLMTGLDDYQGQAPIATLVKYGAILATRVNGHIMTVEEKGPYEVVFPFDSWPSGLDNRLLYLAVYQLAEIEVI